MPEKLAYAKANTIVQTNQKEGILSQLLKTIGKNMRLYRGKRKLTQAQLYAKIGCHRSYICRIENAKINIFLSTLIRIAKALKVRPGDLVK